MHHKQRGKRQLVGMIHVGPLPGSPKSGPPIARIVEQAALEARMYEDAGFDAVIVENMHDLPYLKRLVPPTTIAAMTLVTQAVREATPNLICGVQILAGANQAALAVAHLCSAAFIRCEGFVYGHLADEGWMDADAATLLRERQSLDAKNVKIWADIQKKHAAHAVTADLEAEDWAMAAELNGADMLVVTGKHTGRAVDIKFLRRARTATQLPVAIGSGLDATNLPDYLEHADAFIIGSSVKIDGDWRLAPDPARLKTIRHLFHS